MLFLIFNCKDFELTYCISADIIQSNRKSLKLWKSWSKPHKNQSGIDWDVISWKFEVRSQHFCHFQFYKGGCSQFFLKLVIWQLASFDCNKITALCYFSRSLLSCPSNYSNQSGKPQIVVMAAKAVWSAEDYFPYTHIGDRRLLGGAGGSRLFQCLSFGLHKGYLSYIFKKDGGTFYWKRRKISRFKLLATNA